MGIERGVSLTEEDEMTDLENAKLELSKLDRRIERICSGLENDSMIGVLSYDVGASDAEYEEFIAEVSDALLGLCANYRNGLLAKIALLACL